MGVPAFFRWLTEKYPKILQDVLEARHPLPPSNLDLTAPNPSNLECDNFYIDMNGIIHPCSHPENGPQPSSELEMYENVCNYVDRLFAAVRPRRLLYLAIDGVAPRAKMNQQRSRRFRAAQEIREAKELENDIRNNMSKEGLSVPAKKETWDSNVITPGTTFMRKLSSHIQSYVQDRMANHPAWKNIQVIFSDASIPGEGEHKIISHIRLQRSQHGYDPNMLHILHGLDADLIMLALATHEVNFYILREEVTFGHRGAAVTERRKRESGFEDAQRSLDDEVGEEAMQLDANKAKPLVRLSVPVLREYLEFEFGGLLEQLPFEKSLERLIDDVVFLCFFVGNDFLPHLPSLDIRDGALDFLFNVYKRVLPDLGGYITSHGGEVELRRVDVILQEVGKIEDYVFQMRQKGEEDKKMKREQRNWRPVKPNEAKAIEPPKVMGRAAKILKEREEQEQNKGNVALGRKFEYKEQARKKFKVSHDHDASDAVEVETKEETREHKDENPNEATSKPNSKKRTADEISPKVNEDDDSDDNIFGEDSDEAEVIVIDDEEEDEEEQQEQLTEEEEASAAKMLKMKLKKAEQDKLDEYSKKVEDKVRLHEPGWKDRYYTDKCKAENISSHGGRNHLFRQYILGLTWVMKYYYFGVPSWKWYYPFHYAPFASDLQQIHTWFRSTDLKFELHEPFKPVEQLMAVLPEESSHAIPEASRWLMSSEESPILDFYPKDVPVDPNGKAMPWLWVVLLPFIDEKRLLKALKPTMKGWTKEESKNNVQGDDDGVLYVSSKKASLGEAKGEDQKVQLPDENRLVRGSVNKAKKRNKVYHAVFTDSPQRMHRSVLLAGAVIPKKVLTPEDSRIRRPKLNGFRGMTIANMGGERKHHQPNDYYGNQNHYNQNPPPQQYNVNQLLPATTQWHQNMQPAPQHYHRSNWRGGSQRPQQSYGAPNPPRSFQRQPPPSQYQPRSHTWQQQSQPHQHQHPPPSSYPPSHQLHMRWQRPSPPPPTSYHQQQQQTQHQYVFNRNGGPRQYQPQQQQHQQQQNQQQNQQQRQSHTSRVNPNLMKSLRSQLANTIQQNRNKRN